VLAFSLDDKVLNAVLICSFVEIS